MQKITRPHLRRFLETVATDITVLDVGGGRTGDNHSYEDLFPNRVTVDIDPDRQPDVVGDAHELPFPDASQDVVLCTEVLEHLHTPAQAISEFRRVLRPGGQLILTTRFVYPLHDVPHDYYRYTPYGLTHLLAGWQDVTVTPETASFETVGALVQRIGFQSTVRGGKLTKACLYGLAWLCTKLDGLLVRQYGDIKKAEPVDWIMSTGCYVTARK